MNSRNKNGNEDIDWDLVDEFVKTFEPTEADMKYEFSYDELKELCLRVPCKVLMSRWNPVDDYTKRFSREGRLQTKSYRQTLKLLSKAVNRHKEQCVYQSVEIQPVIQEEWRQRKKDNILRLQVFEYDRNQINANNDSVNTTACSFDDTALNSMPANNRSECISEYSSNSIIENNAYEMLPPETPIAAAYSIVKVDTEEFVENNNNESVNSQLINDFLCLNTESMTLNTHSIHIDSQDDKASQVIFSNPADYDDFNNQIPLTSTQSQSQPLQTQQMQ